MRGLHRTDLVCPACRYDVAQTLSDGIKICPECGTAVSIETCLRNESHLQPTARICLYLIWLAPAAAMASQLVAPLRWTMALVTVSALVVYGSMYWVERWLNTARPAVAAVGPAAAVVVAELACPPVIAGVIVVIVLVELYRMTFPAEGMLEEG